MILILYLKKFMNILEFKDHLMIRNYFAIGIIFYLVTLLVCYIN
jgi:hypothetical protein